LRYVEYGKENNEVMILLHGGGLSWWNYREAAEKLQRNYRVILPILDGHAGSDKSFSTIEDNAAEIIEFIDAQFGGSVLLISGLSLGGQILLEILSRRENVCKYAIVESALVIPSIFLYSMIRPAFGSCYGLIKYKWFSKLQFKSLRIKSDLFEDYFRDTCEITKEDMISILQANSMYFLKEMIENCKAKVYVFVGEKESSVMRKSAAMIHENLEGSSLQILPEMYHGEFSINHAKDFVNVVCEILR